MFENFLFILFCYMFDIKCISHYCYGVYRRITFQWYIWKYVVNCCFWCILFCLFLFFSGEVFKWNLLWYYLFFLLHMNLLYHVNSAVYPHSSIFFFHITIFLSVRFNFRMKNTHIQISGGYLLRNWRHSVIFFFLGIFSFSFFVNIEHSRLNVTVVWQSKIIFE